MADSPKLSESSQALFCAVVDYLGKPITGNKRPPNYPAFFIGAFLRMSIIVSLSFG